MGFDVVIIGGGFGGLEAAFTLRGLVGDAIKITLIDRQSFHSFIPSIHEISSGKISTRSIQIPLEIVLAPAGIQFVCDEVSAIDIQNRRVTVGDGTLVYDCLMLATGAENNFLGVPGAEEISFRFRTPDDAIKIRENLTRLFEEGRADIHLVLAGGGTEGVEVAGELLDLIQDRRDRIDAAPKNVTITVIEAQHQLLPGFPPVAREFAETYLRDRGVTVITGQRITAVRDASLVLASDGELSHSMLIWTGGIKPSRLINGLSLPKDPAGWLIVTDQLRSPADERFYAVGDVVTIQGPDGALPLPRLAHHARDQAEVAGLNIASFLSGKEMIRYKPRFKPQLISIGRGMGIYTQGTTFKSGEWVVDLKKAIERKHLMSYLTRPLIAGISRKVPGIDMFKRLGIKLHL